MVAVLVRARALVIALELVKPLVQVLVMVVVNMAVKVLVKADAATMLVKESQIVNY